MSGAKRALTPAERARLERAREWIVALAEDITRDFPSSDREDLESSGVVKASELMPDFDPAIQDDLKAYLYWPVRGAMLDAAMDTAEFGSRKRALVDMDLRSGPVTESKREIMALTMGGEAPANDRAELRKYIQLRAAGLVWGAMTLSAPDDVETALAKRQEHARASRCLHQAVEALDQRARIVLDAVYRKGLTNDETGASLPKPLSGKQVQRLHKEAREALRAALVAEGIFAAPEIVDAP